MAGVAPQSAFVPAGVDSEAVLELTVVMTVGATLILLLVAVLSVLSLSGREPNGGNAVVIGGIAFPLATLVVLFVYEIGVLGRIQSRAAAGRPAHRGPPAA